MSKKNRKQASFWDDETGEWDDSGYGGASSRSFGFRSYDDYGSYWGRYSPYVDSWKKDSSGNIVHPSVSWRDNDITSDVSFQYNQRGNAYLKREETWPAYIRARHGRNDMTADEFLPKFIGGDIFRLLYHETPQLTKPTEGKVQWLDALSSLPIYGLTMQTNKSNFWSSVATKAMLKYIVNKLMADEMKKDKNYMSGVVNNETNIDSVKQASENVKRAVEDMMNMSDGDSPTESQRAMIEAMKQVLEGATEEASKQMSATRSLLNELGIDPQDLDGGKDGGGNGMGGKYAGDNVVQMYHELLEKRADMIQAFQANPQAIVEFLKVLNNFFQTAIGKQRNFQDAFLGADTINDIINPELFEFPFELHNINVMTNKRSVQVDIYIDISGSMGRRLTSKVGGRSDLTYLDAVSIFAYKLHRQGIVRNIYTFDGSVRSVKPDKLLFLQMGGGTSFDAVMEDYLRSRKEGSKTLGFVLTDGEDDTHLFHKDMYWMFIEGQPYDQMRKNFSTDNMRVWRNGEICYVNGKNR